MILNAIKQMERASRQDASVVSLSQGIPFRESDEAIREAAIRAIQAGLVDQYSDPQGIVGLREEIAKTLAEQGMRYGADEILVTAGAIEGLATVLHTVIRPDHGEVIVPSPVYAAYSRSVQLAGGTVVPVALDEERGWQLEVAAVHAAITNHTAAILICNPNNPTGSVYPKETLLQLAALAAEHNILLLVDEVYGNMLYDRVEFFSPAMVEGFRRCVVRIVSFSKDFALAGWRVGYLHADQALIEQLVAVHDALVNCAPLVSQYAAIEALKQQRRVFVANVHIYKRHRKIMTYYLDALSPLVTYTMPVGAYFCFVKLPAGADSMQSCLDMLRKQKVAVVPGVDFGFGGEGHVRLYFGRSAQAIHAGMQRFSKYIRENYS